MGATDYASVGVASIRETEGLGSFARYSSSQSQPNYVGTGPTGERGDGNSSGWDGTILITFASPTSKVGIGVADSQGAAEVLSVYDSGFNLLESSTAPSGANTYSGFQRANADIKYFQIRGDFFAIDDLQFQSGPTVGIDINDTPDQSDDITLFDPPPLVQAYTQTVPAKVTNNSGAQGVFTLSVEPAGAATLSQTSLTLAAGESTEVTITPTADSSAANDVHIVAMQGNSQVGTEDMTIVQVTFAQQIRNADTPAAMPDRIPPRVDTPIHVDVSPDLAGSGQHVTLAVNNQDANNGTVTLNGAATADITSSGDVNFRGVTQTAPGGNFSNLRATLRVRGQDTTQSNGFSVSAIVVNFQQTSGQALAGGVLQFVYTWESDSGNLADLDQVWIGEHVTYSDGGIHAGPRRPWHGNNPDPTITPPRTPGDATLGTFTDTHSPPGGLPRPGQAVSFTATQYYGFHDYRTDNRADDSSLSWQVNLTPAITISRFVELVTEGHRRVWQYRITKSGVTATARLTGP